MKFLFDLDETLIQGDLISNTSAGLLKNGLCDRLYTNRDIHNYDLKDLPDLVRERVLDNFSDPEYVWYKFPIPGAYYFVRELETQGHDIGIITARPQPIQSETKRFIQARFPHVTWTIGVNFVNDNERMGAEEMPSKLQLLRQLGPNYYFDDNVDYCIESKKLGIDTYLISNKHTPWNHDFAKQQRTKLDPVKVLRNVAFFPETRVYG